MVVRTVGLAAVLAVAGSAPLLPETFNAWTQRTGHTIVERYGMSANLGPFAVLAIIVFMAPLILPAAALMTVVASFTRSFREAQTYVSFVIMIPALPLAFVNMLELQRSLPLMAVPSLSQHFLMTSVLRGESPALAEVVMSAGVSLALGALLSWVAGRLYEREAILG